MPINLANPVVFPNGTRVLVTNVKPDDDNQIMYFTVELRTPNASDHVVTIENLIVRNGICDQVTRGTLLPNASFDEAIRKLPGALNLPTGFTDAMNIWKGGNNSGSRKAALETYLLGVGVIDSTLSGT